MKIENLKRARQLEEMLNKNVIPAIAKIQKFISEKKKDIHGHEPCGGLYSFFLHEYQDGSGHEIDLTNCGIGINILKHAKSLLLEKKAQIEEEITKL